VMIADDDEERDDELARLQKLLGMTRTAPASDDNDEVDGDGDDFDDDDDDATDDTEDD
jgi:hypothetical protein